MADVYLGPVGTEVLLPPLRFVSSPPSLPVQVDRQIDEAEMVDGSRHWAFFGTKREWNWVGEYLTLAQLNTLLALNALNQTLHYQNNNIDATWYYVVISSFRHEPQWTSNQACGRFRCEFTLREA